jgi:hypothetical protein
MYKSRKGLQIILHLDEKLEISFNSIININIILWHLAIYFSNDFSFFLFLFLPSTNTMEHNSSWKIKLRNHMLKKFTIFLETRRFGTVFKTTWHWMLNQLNPFGILTLQVFLS